MMVGLTLPTCVLSFTAHQLEGIFRISGRQTLVREIYLKLLENEFSFEGVDLHELAGALKLYLRELEIPVIPLESYDTFLSAIAGKFVEAVG